MTDPYAWIDPALDSIRRAGWQRQVQVLNSLPGPIVHLESQPLINFASNDYLGLAGDPRLVEAAVAAVQKFGTGATGSRLLSGHRSLHDELEQAIAHWKQTEAALVFSSGYLANIGTISTLVGKRDLILADQYNHSSLKLGSRLSGATLLEYAHLDLSSLEQILHTQRDRYRRCLLLTDSVFSMDGDLCTLPQLLDLAEQFNCMVLIDEAHATGVFGQTGSGCVEHFGCRQRPLVQMGTLSKALGSLGGYVAGSQALIEFLRNRAPSWIYTTGLSPADTAAARAAIAIVQAEPERRKHLWRNITYLKQRLDDLGLVQAETPSIQTFTRLKRLPSDSPIICLQVKDPQTVMHLGQVLKAAGIFAAAVRPPTVPTSRLRLTVMATHTLEQCDRLLHALGHCCEP